MQTEALIRVLAANPLPLRPPIGRLLAQYVAIGFAGSAVLFAVLIGPRPDFWAVIDTWRFDLKFVVTLLFGVASLALAGRLACPGARLWSWILAALTAPLLLVLACGIELSAIDPALWKARLVGSNARDCLTIIPMLSVPLFVAALIALREGAPTRPRLAGAAAGLLAGSFAAALYAAQCTDDSPLFVATWYPIAIGLMALMGAAIGGRLLRW